MTVTQIGRYDVAGGKAEVYDNMTVIYYPIPNMGSWRIFRGFVDLEAMMDFVDFGDFSPSETNAFIRETGKTFIKSEEIHYE